MLDALETTRELPAGRIDADTYHTPESFDVARLAAGDGPGRCGCPRWPPGAALKLGVVAWGLTSNDRGT